MTTQTLEFGIHPPRTSIGARKILVIKLGALGDIILAMEAFQAIRKHHANDSITLLTRKPFVLLTEKMPWFDSIWPDPAPKLLEVSKWLAFRRHLRSANFSRVYDLQCNDRAGFYFRLLGPGRPEWCGVARGCSHPRPDFGGENLPVTERLLRLIDVISLCHGGGIGKNPNLVRVCASRLPVAPPAIVSSSTGS